MSARFVRFGALFRPSGFAPRPIVPGRGPSGFCPGSSCPPGACFCGRLRLLFRSPPPPKLLLWCATACASLVNLAWPGGPVSAPLAPICPPPGGGSLPAPRACQFAQCCRLSGNKTKTEKPDRGSVFRRTKSRAAKNSRKTTSKKTSCRHSCRHLPNQKKPRRISTTDDKHEKKLKPYK